MKKVIGLLVFLALLAQGAWADVNLSWTQLEAWGVQRLAFKLMIEAGNGKILIGQEKELDLHQRAAGLGYRMRIFRMDGNNVSAVDTIPLPLAIWDQIAINDDGTQALVSGELGTKILEVDLPARTYRVVMENHKGQPGFRNDPRIEWYDGQSYYMTGYFYDAKGIAGPDVVVRVNLAQSGVAAFEKVMDVQPVEKQTSPRYLSRIIMSPEQAVFIGGQPLALKVFNAGKVEQLDSGIAFGTLAACVNRVLYSIRRFGTTVQHRECWLKDFASGQKWKIGQEDVPYQYGFISRDGKTIAVSDIDLRAHHMSVYYGKEADGFALKPIASLQNRPIGNFRLSADGTGWAWLDIQSIRMGTLP